MIKVCLIGAGRAGAEVAKLLWEQKDIKLEGVVCRPDSMKVGMDIGDVIGANKTGITVSDDLRETVFRIKPDVVVDFSSALPARENALLLSDMKINIVIGTTGFSEDDIETISMVARKNHNGIVYAPNITQGVNVLMLLSNIAARLLSEYDFQINETHHRHKKDAPSGTAIKIAKEIEKVFASLNNQNFVIPINAARVGGVVGKHEVIIAGEDDQITITHESYSRKAFASGALKAIRFIYQKDGFYEAEDVFGFMDNVLSLIDRDKCGYGLA